VHPKSGASIVTPGADGEGTRLHNGWRITPAGKKTIGTGDMLLGGAISPDGKLLAISNSGFGAHALHVIDLATETEIANLPVPRSWNGLAWTPDSRRIYVSAGISNPLGDVYVFDRFDNGQWGLHGVLTLFEADRNKTCIAGLALSPDGTVLYALNNSDNHLYVVETATGAGLARIEIGDHPLVAKVSKDGRTLFVANWGGSEVAAVDVSDPTAVHVTADGKRLIVGSGKGLGTHPNPVMTPIDPDAAVGFEYHAFQLKGVLAFVDLPDEAQLAAYTKQVYANTPYNDALIMTPAQPPARPTAIPTKVGDPSPIKHVLYIIKENRTYDQVLGDIAKGNGDPKLTLLGREATPNHHALAEEFVLLDNLYCNGEVSADGHPWSTSAYATDFTQRSWVLDYSKKGKTVATESVTRPPNGYIWEAALKKGLLVQGYYQLHPTLMDHSTCATSRARGGARRAAGRRGAIPISRGSSSKISRSSRRPARCRTS